MPPQEGNLKLGSWQMVLWQPRWVHAETDALCYQKITSDERPIGKQKRIEFRDIREIEELENAEFVLQTNKRDYTFKAPNENRCQVRERPLDPRLSLASAVRRVQSGHASSSMVALTLNAIAHSRRFSCTICASCAP